MPDIVNQNLKKKEQSSDLQQLLQSTVELARNSRSKMSEYYAEWDAAYAAYKSEMEKDSSDDKASERKEPNKQVVPITFSQLMAFVAFMKMLYKDRKTFFELEPMGQEDVKTFSIAEQLLDFDLNHNQWGLKFYQSMQNIGIFSLAVIQLEWVKEVQKIKSTPPVGETLVDGITVPTGGEPVATDKVLYEGNKLTVISPYSFFPDTRLPLAEFRRGEFCGSYREFTKIELQRLEATGFFQGIDHVEEVKDEDASAFKNLRLGMFEGIDTLSAGRERARGNYAILHMERWIVPSKFKIDGNPIGPEKTPVLYDIWVANEKRIIRLEKSDNTSEGFSYFAGQYDADLNSIVPSGLANKINELQNVISWLFNSHITSVRKVIQNWLIADPSAVELEDIKMRRPVIRLKKNARSGSIDRYIKQLEVQDVTQNHISDVNMVIELVKLTTGITDNMLGQFASGRRSAKEAGQVYQSAAARLEMIASNIDEQLFVPLGKAMLANSSELLEEEKIIKIRGVEEEMTPAYIKEAMASGQASRFQDIIFFKLSKDTIRGNYDFKFVNPGSPAQKSVLGAVLNDVFTALIANPQGAIASNIDPGKVLRQLLKLNGVNNLNQFSFDPDVLAQLYTTQLGGQPPAPEQAPVEGPVGGPGGSPPLSVVA
jgi:hypothetical protein